MTPNAAPASTTMDTVNAEIAAFQQACRINYYRAVREWDNDGPHADFADDLTVGDYLSEARAVIERDANQLTAAFPSVEFIGVPRPEIVAKEVEISVGRNRTDMNWRTVKSTFGELLAGRIAKHEIGPKDGACILQGALSGPQRTIRSMSKNYLVMVDVDTGETLDEVQQVLIDCGLFGVLWTTHSHLKDTSSIVEDAFLNWLREQPTSKLGGDEINNVACYLREIKKYTVPLCESVESVEKKFVEGGLKYIVKHAPMARLRILFILEDPFDFANRGTHVEAMEEWKAIYRNFSDKLGVTWDVKCIDPCRLMYLPRRGADIPAELHEIRVIWGDPLTIERMKESNKGADPLDALVGQDAGKKKFHTDNLMRFIAQYGATFQAADWLESVDASGSRGYRSSAAGIHFQCPNEDCHSVITTDDKAFFATNGGDNCDGFILYCMHTTCGTMSDGDRAWFLDKACQKYDVKDAMELRTFCTGAGQEQAAVEARGAAIAAEETARPGFLNDLISEMNGETPIKGVVELLNAIARLPRSPMNDDRIDRIAELTGRGKLRVRQWEKAARSNAVSRVSAANLRAPEDVSAHEGPVRLDWDFQTQCDVSMALFERAHRSEGNPTCFKREEGGCVRVVQTERGAQLEPLQVNSAWLNELTKHVRFERIDRQTNTYCGVAPPRDVVKFIEGSRDLRLTTIKRVAHVPILGRDGSLRTERGYDASTRVFLDPFDECRVIPNTIPSELVEEAVSILREAFCDFPYSDNFGGVDNVQIKKDELDEDGYSIPNWERGKSSFANCLAMTIQPFVREVIDGPCPAYHIDKSAPGTGAGYLVDVASIIAVGRKATAQVLSPDNEEGRKSITASLRGCQEMLFLDNINHHVDSGPLASVITAGSWSDRILGQSSMCTIRVDATWVMAGNNLSFSHELMRRVIPIRLDAATPNPARDRKQADFKHHPLHSWLFEKRPQLVWAVHVLILNWARNHKMKCGTKSLGSFESWAGVMSGILEAANVPGFLGNIPAYLEAGETEQSAQNDIVELIWKTYNDRMFRPMEFTDLISSGLQSVTLQSLGIDPKRYSTSRDQARRFGEYARKHLVGIVSVVKTDSGVKRVSFNKLTDDASGARYQLAEIATKN